MATLDERVAATEKIIPTLATKLDLTELEGRLTVAMTGMETRIKAELRADMTGMETRIKAELKADNREQADRLLEAIQRGTSANF